MYKNNSTITSVINTCSGRQNIPTGRKLKSSIIKNNKNKIKNVHITASMCSYFENSSLSEKNKTRLKSLSRIQHTDTLTIQNQF